MINTAVQTGIYTTLILKTEKYLWFVFESKVKPLRFRLVKMVLQSNYIIMFINCSKD